MPLSPPSSRSASRSSRARPAPLYLLEGDDLQSRHDLALEFAAVVDEGLHAFNVESLYANEASNAAGRDGLIGNILSTARTLPMMSPRRVIIVHEAETLLSPKRGGKDEDELPGRWTWARRASAARRRWRSSRPTSRSPSR